MEVSMKNIIGYDMADVLALAGLARKPTTFETLLPAIGLVAAGIAIGAGLGLFLAPESARLLRDDVGRNVNYHMGQLRERVAEKANETKQAFLNNTTPHSNV
jgi:hypothetical protein